MPCHINYTGLMRLSYSHLLYIFLFWCFLQDNALFYYNKQLPIHFLYFILHKTEDSLGLVWIFHFLHKILWLSEIYSLHLKWISLPPYFVCKFVFYSSVIVLIESAAYFIISTFCFFIIWIDFNGQVLQLLLWFLSCSSFKSGTYVKRTSKSKLYGVFYFSMIKKKSLVFRTGTTAMVRN